MWTLAISALTNPAKSVEPQSRAMTEKGGWSTPQAGSALTVSL